MYPSIIQLQLVKNIRIDRMCSERKIGPTFYKVSLTINFFYNALILLKNTFNFCCYIYNYMLTPTPKPTLKLTHTPLANTKGIL